MNARRPAADPVAVGPAATGPVAAGPGPARPLFTLSVDVESWIHGRWASGSDRALWPDSLAGYRASYGLDRPGPPFADSLARTLALLDRLGVPATFFMLTEMAAFYPDFLRAIRDRGHEIALHGLHHIDNSRYDDRQFRDVLCRGRDRLAALAGTEIVGYRAPNLILSSRQLAILAAEGFRYDSSVCPARRLFGKFTNMAGAPQSPYRPARDDLARPAAGAGALDIVELPLSVFPGIGLPGSSAILARAIGGWWARVAVGRTLRRGYGLFYFHPWELGPREPLPAGIAAAKRPYLWLFRRNIGAGFERFAAGWLGRLAREAEFLTARALAERVRAAEATGAAAPAASTSL